MAYFAKINNNIVEQVISISNDIASDPWPAGETAGQDYINTVLGLPGTWLQTSYNSNFRRFYAGIGYSYISDADEFRPPAPSEGVWTWDDAQGQWTEQQ
jgi:hypothetical protein